MVVANEAMQIIKDSDGQEDSVWQSAVDDLAMSAVKVLMGVDYPVNPADSVCDRLNFVLVECHGFDGSNRTRAFVLASSSWIGRAWELWAVSAVKSRRFFSKCAMSVPRGLFDKVRIDATL